VPFPKAISHPLLAIRDSLNERFPPSSVKLRSMLRRHRNRAEDASGEGTGDGVQYVRIPAGAGTEALFAKIVAHLDRHSVRYLAGGGPVPSAMRLNIAGSDAPSFVSVLATALDRDSSVCIRAAGGRIKPPDAAAEILAGNKARSFELMNPERTCDGPRGRTVFYSAIEVNIWNEMETHSGETLLQSGLNSPYASQIRPGTFRDLQDRGGDLADHESPVGFVRFPVDIVYTWVDDRDAEWRDLKARHLGAIAKSGGRSGDSERFRNREELRYSLRSVELFAPFVRTIHIVTSGQIPAWLDLDHPKIRIVPHSEIYRSPDMLPTFNSSGIETQLHHIDGLAEHFLYFNDDFFLGKVCSAEDFFFSNGMLKYFPGRKRVFEADIDESSEEYIAADANAIGLIGGAYGSCNREIMQHAPYPSSRSLLSKMEDMFRTEFDKCAASKFRSADDLRPIAFMQYHMGFHERMAVPSRISHRYLTLSAPSIAAQLEEILLSRKYRTFCINDGWVAPEKAQATDTLVRDFLEHYFPLKSTFEI